MAGLIGVLSDHSNAAKAVEPSPQPVAKQVRAAQESVRGIELSDVAAAMARLEQRLNATAAEVADLIRHMEDSKSRP